MMDDGVRATRRLATWRRLVKIDDLGVWFDKFVGRNSVLVWERNVVTKLSLTTVALLAGTWAFIGMAHAQPADHQMITPNDLKWTAVPAIPGAQIALIEGPMDKAGAPFTARLKFPANSRVPPHWHSTIEHVTVLSGVANMGVGDKFDRDKTQALGPGSVSIMQPGTHHFVWFGEDTVLQLHGIGPWTVSYVNPADDPKHQATQ